MRIFPSGGGYIEFTSEGENFENDLTKVPIDEDVTLSASFLFYEQSVTFCLRQCGELPTLCIDGQSGVLDFLNESKDNRQDVKATFYDPQGAVMLSEMAVMYGRGNSTWWMGDKKPYNLKFSGSVSVGPFEEVSKLNLLAEYYDNSKMRNALVYYAGNQLEIPYSTDYMLLDLFVNGEYVGIYGAANKDAYLKDLEKDEVKAVFTITSGQEFDFWPRLWRNPVRILYGDWDFTWETIFCLEKALESRDWIECSRRIDMDSFAKKYVMEEFFVNADTGYASQYFYIDKDDVIHCMLPWDYDLTMGNTFYYYNNKAALELTAYRDNPNWYSVLLENDQFRQTCLDVLQDRFTEPFVSSLETYLESTSCEIEGSWYCDKARWGTANLPGMESVSHLTVRDHPSQFAGFLRDRVTFLEAVLQNWEDYYMVLFQGVDDWTGNLCIPKGSQLSSYLEDATILKRGSNESRWRTEDGSYPEEIDTVTGDITFRIKQNGP